jgi:hypothetical protein
MLRYAQRFHGKFSKNIIIFRDFFFQFVFWLSWYHIQFGVCLQKFWGSRPTGLGGDRERTNST